MTMTVEHAFLYLSENSLWSNIDKKFGRLMTKNIKNNIDLTSRQRRMGARKLKKYKEHFPNWKPLSRNLSKWEKVEVHADVVQLPRLHYDGKELILYVGIGQVDEGLKVPNGKRRKTSLEWRYSAGSEKTHELWMMAQTSGWSISWTARDHIKSQMTKLMEKRDSVEKVREMKHAAETYLDLPLLTEPYEHQKKAMAIGIELKRAALLMEQGTGKTLSAIGIAAHHFLEGNIKRLLVVAPKSVLPEWAMQFEEHTELPYQAQALDMKSKKKEEVFDTWEDAEGAISILTINYESLHSFEKQLVKWNPDMIILDESQKVKNPTTVQAKTIYRIADKCDVEYRLILTGTPVSESPLDFFGQYRFLDPSIFGYSYREFKGKYANFDYWGRKVVSYNNEEELASRAHSIAYRITKAEANLNLPKENFEIAKITLDNEEQNSYDYMEEDAVLQLSQDLIAAPLIVTQLMKLQQITGGFIKDEDGTVHKLGSSKLEELKRILVPRIKNKQKTVIFCNFVSEIGSIHEWLKELGTSHETLMGSTKDRGGALKRFKSDPENLIFLAQIKAGGVGITLTSADMAIFFSTGYSLIDYEQAKARIHRIGQTKPVTHLHLLAKGTIDEVIYEALRKKKQTADIFVDQLKFITHKSEEEINMAKMEERLEDLKQDLATEEGTTEVKSKRRRGKKQSGEESTLSTEKAPKKEKAPKAPKEEKVVVSLAAIAEEMGTTPAELRKHLRKSEIAKPEGRWEWEPGHADIERVKALDLTPAPKKSKKADTEETAATDAE